MTREKPLEDEGCKGIVVGLGRGSYALAAIRSLQEEIAKGIHVRLPAEDCESSGCEAYELYQRSKHPKGLDHLIYTGYDES